MINSANILKNYGLRQTEFRRSLIDLFYKSNSLTAEDVKNKIKIKSDKVTIYRALESFEKSGLIHKVPDQDNLTRYALCESECNTLCEPKCRPSDHIHNHAHFICKKCSDTFCIQEIEHPIIKKSEKYIVSEIELTLKGICVNCK